MSVKNKKKTCHIHVEPATLVILSKMVFDKVP